MKRYIKSDINYEDGGSCSFDFAYSSDYNMTDISNCIARTCNNYNIELIGTPDFRSVDYSMYAEYHNKQVGQCGFDFLSAPGFEYFEKDFIDSLDEELADIRIDLIGYDFYTTP